MGPAATDAPGLHAPRSESAHRRVERRVGGSALRRTQLSVHVGCSTDGYCSATAQGGTGVYESWEWYGAYEDVDDGGSWSTATFNCASGYVMQVAARVKDSSGATYLGETLVFCPH